MTEAANEEAATAACPIVSAVSVLTSLADYVEAHSDGRRHQQAAAWNLTKARRVVSARTLGSVLLTTNTTLTAQSIVRPLLTPTRTVKIVDTAASSSKLPDADEIELWNETVAEPKIAKMTKKDVSVDTTTPFVPIFSLIDPTSAQSDGINAHETEENTKENQENGFSEALNGNMSTGLRQRKAANTNKEWKIEKPAIVEPQPAKKSAATTTCPETDLLVTLFSTMPPAELRQAQVEAVAALQNYCHAATQVAALMAALSVSETTQPH
jgi:hypothetical protein